MPKPKKVSKIGAGFAAAMQELKARFPESSVYFLNDAPPSNIEAYSTGSLGLDFALGVGGVPAGRVTEIYGPEASGKTTLGQHIIKSVLDKHEENLCLFIESEQSFDRKYAAAMGLDFSRLVFSQPGCGEEALEMALKGIQSGEFRLIFIDSVATLIPLAELEGSVGDAHIGLQARLMSQFLRMAPGAMRMNNTAIVFTNQVRSNIGTGPFAGNPETTPGGKALRFTASVRIRVQRIEQIKVGDTVVGIRSKAKVEKNKMAPPFQTCEYSIYFGEGVNLEVELLDYGAELGLVSKKGSYFYYEEASIGQGREAARHYLKDNKDVARALEAQIRARWEEGRASGDEESDLSTF